MRLTILIAALCLPAVAIAQNIRTLPAGTPSPPATVAAIGWMAGHWEGRGLEGYSFETISPPLAGQMVGHFQQVKEGKIDFFEFYQFAERDGSLVLRIKHFGPDLVGWEEKDKAVEFPLVAIDKDAAYFSGLTMRRTGPDEMETFVNIDRGGGRTEEAHFRFKRARR